MKSSDDGLTSTEVEKRLQEYGQNILEEKKAGKSDSSSGKESEDTPDKSGADKGSEESSDKEGKSPDERKKSDEKPSEKEEDSSEKGSPDASKPDDGEEAPGDTDKRGDDEKGADDKPESSDDDHDPDESENPEEEESGREDCGAESEEGSEEETESAEDGSPDDTDKSEEEANPEETSADKSTPDGTPMEKDPDLEEEDPFVCDDLDLETIKSEEEIISKDRIQVSETVNSEPADFSKKEDTERVEIDREANPAYAGRTIECKNYIVTGVSEKTMEAYNGILERNRSSVSRFSRTLTKLSHEPEHRERAMAGRLNRENYTFKRHTSLRVFDKVTQKDRTNARIVIALDVSGSMQGNKINKAKEALACIVEGLTNAGIPVKVMTFCDHGNYVEHHHYVNYRISKAARSSIMQIQAGGDNFDGYSIRYALKEVMKLRTRNRLLMVISDGAPLTRMVSNPTQDAINAIKEAKRKTKVIGIGIDANKDVLRRMYTDTFVELDNIESLMSTLCKIVLKEVQKWQ